LKWLHQSLFDEALNTLNDELLTAKLTAVAFNNLHADIEGFAASLHDPHGWVFLVVQMVDRLDTGVRSAGMAVRPKALPVLEDMENVTRSK
jgi:RecA/RadA recombinase